VEYRRLGGLLSPRRRPVRAVDGVDLAVCCGETLGVVGESGCGKTTLGRALVRLVAPARGRILVDGTDILALRGEELRRFRPNIQMIFQNPASSLDPRMRVFDLVAEPLRAHLRLKPAALTARVRESLDQVGIYKSQWDRYPSALSGGQAQRVAIARVMAVGPRIVVLDEPTSALDVSVQAQVVNLLRRLQGELQLTYLFISHDLALVDHLSDRIAVMYLGQVVEIAGRTEILNTPHHPYTQALLSASPVPDPDRKRGRIMLGGTVPDAAAPPPGCRFHPRCPAAVADCQHATPSLVAVSDTHGVACILSGGRQG
jgi:oligopeptide/dipeptide ABC transporter ATP-binding protein